MEPNLIRYALINLTKTEEMYTQRIEKWQNQTTQDRQKRSKLSSHMVEDYEIEIIEMGVTPQKTSRREMHWLRRSPNMQIEQRRLRSAWHIWRQSPEINYPWCKCSNRPSRHTSSNPPPPRCVLNATTTTSDTQPLSYDLCPSTDEIPITSVILANI